MTVMNEEARREVVQSALEAHDQEPAPERVRMSVRGAEELLPVVRLPLSAVVLNPDSHRIKSQLESHPDREKVKEDPFLDASQEVIEKLLSETDHFEDLRENLKEVGQRDHGVATRAGVLINANTRCAALRELDPHGHIRVAILPGDVDRKDLARLELELQVRRDYKRDYTFTNELLFIDELKSSFDYSDADAARALNWAASSGTKELAEGIKRVRQATRMLATIRELQARSGHQIPTTFFDDKRQALIDLDDAYEAQVKTDAAAADLMREGRLLAILAGGQYRHIREIRSDTVDDYLVPTLHESDACNILVEASMSGDEEPAATETPGLDDLVPAEEEEETAAGLGKLVTALAVSYGKDDIEVANGGGEAVTTSREEFVRGLQEAIEESYDVVRSETKHSQSLEGPIKAVRDARRAVKKALKVYRHVNGKPGFQSGKFSYELKGLSRDLDALKAEASGDE